MIDATICTYPNGENGIVVWKDRDHPTQEEICPPNSAKHKHVILPHDYIAFVLRWSKEQVQKVLSDFLPVAR